MTDAAPPPWGPPDPSTRVGAGGGGAGRDDAAGRQRGRLVEVVALVVVVAVGLVLFGVGAGWLPWSGDDAGPHHPGEWDPRVVDAVAAVERIRDLQFEHPVDVSFLPEDEFVALLTDGGQPTEAEREDAETYAAALRALGLVEGDVDLFAENERVVAEGTLGFYQPDSDDLFVRGQELTPAVRATLVHELTHALQDQHFALDVGLTAPTVGAATAARALIEADAAWVEQEWTSGLSGADLDEYLAEVAEFATGMDVADVPAVFVESTALPYVFGPGLHTALRVEGPEAVDGALDDLPISEEQILDPRAYLDGDEPVTFEMPDVDDLGELDSETDLGAFGLFQVLASRLDYAPTVSAVDGWGGDVMQTYRQDDDTVCVALSVTGDTSTDTDEIAEAFAAWSSDVPDASADREGDVVTLTSCDPDQPLPPSPHRSEAGSAVSALIMRAYAVDQASIAGLDIEATACVGDTLVDEVGPDRLSEVYDEAGSTAPPDDLVAAFTSALETCR